MKALHLTAGLALLTLSPLATRADGVGTVVTGSLQLFGQSVNSFSGANATIGPGLEFSESSFVESVTADFTGSTLAFTARGQAPFLATFSDPSFTSFQQLSLIDGDTVPTYSFSGHTLTISSNPPLIDFTGVGDFSDLFSYGSQMSTAVTPEPSALILLGTGLLGLLGVGRRRSHC